MATPPAQKPWKAEYAKSGRASCRSCSSPTSKDAFRLAKVIQSTQFDGFMAHWHHARCIFKKKKQVHDWNDVEGAEGLRWEDQQRLRKYIEGGPIKDDDEEGKEGKPAKGKGGKSNSIARSEDEEGDSNSGDYAIEIAKSSRSTCKECNEKIEKGQLRISTMTTADTGRFRGPVPQWRHAKCFLDNGYYEGRVGALPGWNILTPDDQTSIRALVPLTSAASAAKRGGQETCSKC